jgi:hypothetical protein
MKRYRATFEVSAVIVGRDEDHAAGYITNIVNDIVGNDDVFGGVVVEEITVGHDDYEIEPENSEDFSDECSMQCFEESEGFSELDTCLEVC